MKLLDLLRAFLRPAVEGEGDPAPDPDQNADPAPDPDPAQDLEADPDSLPEPAKADAPSAEEFAAIAAQAKADKDRADRLEREAEFRRPAHPQVDEQTRQENERLSDPKITDLERWQIQSNRTLREGQNTSRMALMQAQDVNDKTQFSRLAMTKPKLFNMYEDRVEKELQKRRSMGYNYPREQILKELIGEDAMGGKLKPKKAAAAADTNASPALNRGKLPGARSDVRGKAGLTEQEKRRQRLENVQI